MRSIATLRAGLVYILVALGSMLALAACKPSDQAVVLAGAEARDYEFTLTTAMLDGRMVFMGVGGEIDGLENPELKVMPGGSVRIVLINGDGMPHDVTVDGLNAHTSMVSQKGGKTELAIEAPPGEGTYDYYCSVPGHRQLGMQGKLVVEEPD